MDAGYTKEGLGTGFEFVPACTEGAFEGVLQGDGLGVGPEISGEPEEVFHDSA